jgi:hypothetical protein
MLSSSRRARQRVDPAKLSLPQHVRKSRAEAQKIFPWMLGSEMAKYEAVSVAAPQCHCHRRPEHLLSVQAPHSFHFAQPDHMSANVFIPDPITPSKENQVLPQHGKRVI